jgi:hypothetical protein
MPIKIGDLVTDCLRGGVALVIALRDNTGGNHNPPVATIEYLSPCEWAGYARNILVGHLEHYGIEEQED